MPAILVENLKKEFNGLKMVDWEALKIAELEDFADKLVPGLFRGNEKKIRNC